MDEWLREGKGGGTDELMNVLVCPHPLGSGELEVFDLQSQIDLRSNDGILVQKLFPLERGIRSAQGRKWAK